MRIEKSYLEKTKKESIGSLFSSQKIFQRRYGKAFIHFGKPIKIDPTPTTSKVKAEKYVNQVAHSIIREFGKNMTVTFSSLISTALLINKKIESEELNQNIHHLLEIFSKKECHFGFDPADTSNLTKTFLEDYQQRKWVKIENDVITPLYKRRITLDFYKNGILHFLIPDYIKIISNQPKLLSKEEQEIIRKIMYAEFQGAPPKTRRIKMLSPPSAEIETLFHQIFLPDWESYFFLTKRILDGSLICSTSTAKYSSCHPNWRGRI